MMFDYGCLPSIEVKPNCAVSAVWFPKQTAPCVLGKGFSRYLAVYYHLHDTCEHPTLAPHINTPIIWLLTRPYTCWSYPDSMSVYEVSCGIPCGNRIAILRVLKYMTDLFLRRATQLALESEQVKGASVFDGVT